MTSIIFALYMFFAGMTAEYIHTQLKAMGKTGGMFESFFLGMCWPIVIFAIFPRRR